MLGGNLQYICFTFNYSVMFTNNKRYEFGARHGTPVAHQDLKEVDNGVEVLYIEEVSDRYNKVPASSYGLKLQLEQGVPLEKTSVYMHLEKMYGAEVATRTVQELQTRLDNQRVAAAMAESRKKADDEMRNFILQQPAVSPAPSASV